MWPSALRLLLAGACLSLVVSGCSEDDPEPRLSPGGSSSSAPAPSPSGPVEPTLPPEAEGEDAAAAEAFVRHYWAVANHAQSVVDPSPLEAWSSNGCTGCSGAIELLREVQRAGGKIEGGEATVSDLRTRELVAGGQPIFEVTFQVQNTRQVIDMPGTSADRVFEAGTVSDRFDVGKPGDTWQVIRWEIVG